jgi:hypothetical protein
MRDDEIEGISTAETEIQDCDLSYRQDKFLSLNGDRFDLYLQGLQ